MFRRPIDSPAESGSGWVRLAGWRELGEPARSYGIAISAAVDRALAADRSGYLAATAVLTAMPGAQIGLLLGSVLRRLLEDQHPGGLDGDDLRLVLSQCYRNAVAWLPPGSVTAGPLLAAVSSALGVHEPGVTYVEITGPTPRESGDDWAGDPELVSIGASDPAPPAADGRPPTTAEYSRHAPLLIADLLGAGHRSIGRYLDLAFSDIARTETMEMP